jgi:potassium efflux system protein
MGYNYSARQLWLRCLASFLVMLALQLLGALLLRWLYLVRRRLAMAHAEKLRSDEETAAASPSEGLPAVGDETQAELLSWLEQARRLLRWTTGLAFAGCLWGIWSGVLPALQALDNVPLWHIESATAATAAPDGGGGGGTLVSTLTGGAAAAAAPATDVEGVAAGR